MNLYTKTFSLLGGVSRDTRKGIEARYALELANDVALGEVLADEVLGRAEVVGKDASAALYCAPDLSGALPDNLGEVGRLGAVRVVLRCGNCQILTCGVYDQGRTNFVGPGLDGGVNTVAASGTCGEVLCT